MLMTDLDSHVLRPGAFARTPFGTPFFKLFTYPDIDASELCKRRVTRKMREEIATWEKLQRRSKRSESKSDADVFQDPEDREIAAAAVAETVERAVGAGCVVGGDGYPDDSVPSADAGPARRDLAVVHEIEGFVVIDLGDDAESVFRDHKRPRRTEAETAEEYSGFWSRFKGLLTPIGTMDW